MRILLADDAALLREGLAGLLTTAGHEVVAQVADADALRTEVGRLAAAGELPDVVVTDVRMPPTGTDDGLRAAIDLRRNNEANLALENARADAVEAAAKSRAERASGPATDMSEGCTMPGSAWPRLGTMP